MEIMTHVPGTTVELAISGMTCTGCSSSIESALTGLAGVRSASVDHATGRAVVLLDAEASAEDFAFDADAAIHDAGYTLDGATARPERAGGGGCGGGGECGCGGGAAKAPEPVVVETAPEAEGCCGGGGCC